MIDLTTLSGDELADLERAIDDEYNRRILGEDWQAKLDESYRRSGLRKGTPIASPVIVWGTATPRHDDARLD